jgi:hypothetical protein
MNRWRCKECYWVGHDDELLSAPNPFNAEAVIYGCPQCHEVDPFEQLCDVPECNAEATCGWPGPDGYRRTCGKHMKA